jgi:TetR/AcrR family transcriptional regulator, transcriptional repressor for nem operon
MLVSASHSRFRYTRVMARYPAEQKEQTHKKILAVASAIALTEGFAAGIDRIMKAAGLTRGGFYAHFASKADLEAELIGLTLDETRETLCDAAPEGKGALHKLVNMYLSERHRDAREDSCPLPALSADVARADDKTRDVYEGRLLLFAAELEARLPHGGLDRALAAAATLAGGIALARAVRDPALSLRILKACRKAILE